jgi:hypothetical protein
MSTALGKFNSGLGSLKITGWGLEGVETIGLVNVDFDKLVQAVCIVGIAGSLTTLG